MLFGYAFGRGFDVFGVGLGAPRAFGAEGLEAGSCFPPGYLFVPMGVFEGPRVLVEAGLECERAAGLRGAEGAPEESLLP